MEIRTKIAEQLSNISPKVENDVVETLVTREVFKRSAAIVQALEDLSDLEKNLKKIKPDQSGFDVDGKVISETYSKTRLEELNKTKAKIDKYTKAIDNALNGDLSDVYNLNSKKD